MSGSSPRRRRPGTLRQAASEPLGLDAAAEDAAAEDAAADAGAGEAAPKAPSRKGRRGKTTPTESAVEAPAGAPVLDSTDPDRWDDEIATPAAAAGSLALIDPHGDATDVIRDVPEMSVEDVEARIGARTRVRRRRAERAAPVARVATSRRVVLWRDSATILIFVVLALLAARFLLPSDGSTATASPTPVDTPVSIGSVPVSTGLLFSAAPTFGIVVPSNVHIDATPTPIPVITLPPPTPTPAPTATTKPSAKPSPKPSSGTSQPPSQPPAAPIAAFGSSCPVAANTSASFTDSSTGSISSWSWTFGDGGTATSQNPSHTYATPGDWTVTLTVTGPGGSDSQSHLCTVT